MTHTHIIPALLFALVGCSGPDFTASSDPATGGQPSTDGTGGALVALTSPDGSTGGQGSTGSATGGQTAASNPATGGNAPTGTGGSPTGGQATGGTPPTATGGQGSTECPQGSQGCQCNPGNLCAQPSAYSCVAGICCSLGGNCNRPVPNGTGGAAPVCMQGGNGCPCDPSGLCPAPYVCQHATATTLGTCGVNGS